MMSYLLFITCVHFVHNVYYVPTMRIPSVLYNYVASTRLCGLRIYYIVMHIVRGHMPARPDINLIFNRKAFKNHHPL